MIHAYSELYINSSSAILGEAVDYMSFDLNMNYAQIENILVRSRAMVEFGTGNPKYLAGMSGSELAQEMVGEYNPSMEFPEYSSSLEKSREYWAGWALCQYQWYSGKSFKDILDRVPLSIVMSMYDVHHEMDITKFYESMDSIYADRQKESRLKRIRESRGMSQSQLARNAGVNIRNIQMYEQKISKIDNAAVNIVYKLAYILGCDMVDLLEEPLKE